MSPRTISLDAPRSFFPSITRATRAMERMAHMVDGLEAGQAPDAKAITAEYVAALTGFHTALCSELSTDARMDDLDEVSAALAAWASDNGEAGVVADAHAEHRLSKSQLLGRAA